MLHTLRLDYSKLYNALIVDRKLDDILSLRKIISKGFDNIALSHVLNLETALDIMANGSFDFVCLCIDEEDHDYMDVIVKATAHVPNLIIVTSSRELAFQCLQSESVEFIIKPYNPDFVISVIKKTMQKIELFSVYMAAQGITSTNPASNVHAADYIAIGSVGKIDIVRVADIMYCMAEGKYTFFYTTHGKYVASKNIGDYLKVLDPNHFFRIHHSYVVNMKHVVKIERKDGSYCVLNNGITVPFSKRREEEFIRFVKLKS